MIKTNNGVTEIKGYKYVIATDLSVIIRALLNGGDFTKEEIADCVKNADKSDTDLNKEVCDMFKDIMELLDEMHRDLKEDK